MNLIYTSNLTSYNLKDRDGHLPLSSDLLSAATFFRFIAAGPIQRNVAPNTVGVFNFDQAYGLSHEDAKSVSDHYVIELLLRGKVRDHIQHAVVECH